MFTAYFLIDYKFQVAIFMLPERKFEEFDQKINSDYEFRFIFRAKIEHLFSGQKWSCIKLSSSDCDNINGKSLRLT